MCKGMQIWSQNNTIRCTLLTWVSQQNVQGSNIKEMQHLNKSSISSYQTNRTETRRPRVALPPFTKWPLVTNGNQPFLCRQVFHAFPGGRGHNVIYPPTPGVKGHELRRVDLALSTPAVHLACDLLSKRPAGLKPLPVGHTQPENDIGTHHIRITLTDTAVVIWFIISANAYFCITLIFPRKKILKSWCETCWGLYQTNMFTYIWRK